jgi:periplasmic protein TonB
MRVTRPRLNAVLVLAGALGGAGLLIPPAIIAWSSPAAASQARNPRIRPPQAPEIPWSRTPSKGVRENAYPDRALRLEQNGWAVLSCTVRADGGLEGCKVQGEEPRDIGFGQAALSLQGRYQVDLSTAQGQALVGQMVQFVVNFDVLR